jgi:hypothetical protein
VHGARTVEVQGTFTPVPTPHGAAIGRRVGHLECAHHVAVAQQPSGPHTRRLPDRPTPTGYDRPLMSKRTVKRKLRTKKKANHGKKPNCGRG